MRYRDFRIVEAEQQPAPSYDVGNLLGIKQAILDKIEGLPENKDSRRILDRVQDILGKVDAVDNLKAYASRVEEIGISDEDVAKAIDQLTKLIGAAALTTTVKDREFFFKLWESDRLVKVDTLMQGGKVFNLSDLFEYYRTSKAVQYVVNSLSKDAGYGLGKGEFLLAVLSRRIQKAPGKGDLLVDGLSVEVKATDGGSPRFADQEVRVGAGYEQVRDELIKKYSQRQAQGEISPIEAIGGMKRTGLNIDDWIRIGQYVKDKAGFKADTEALLHRIFPEQDSTPILNAIVASKSGTAKSEYANLTYNRYMDIKNDDAVLYINFAAKPEPTFVLFRTVEDLNKMGLYFHSETIYIIGASGNRDVYPQMKVAAVKPN